ncbi:MAG: hypothetical protein WD039_07085 [Xanthobacteraceae bacterium]
MKEEPIVREVPIADSAGGPVMWIASEIERRRCGEAIDATIMAVRAMLRSVCGTVEQAGDLSERGQRAAAIELLATLEDPMSEAAAGLDAVRLLRRRAAGTL